MTSGEPKAVADEMPRRTEKMNALKRQIDVGSYRVDNQAVADAIVQRILAAAAAPRPAEPK